MSLIAARTLVRRSTVAALKAAPRRGAHFENTINNNMPFSYENKAAFAAKTAGFLVLGFSLPFVAAGYQLWKK